MWFLLARLWRCEDESMSMLHVLYFCFALHIHTNTRKVEKTNVVVIGIENTDPGR